LGEESINNIEIHNMCAGRECNDMLKAVEYWGEGRKG
jgi:hypothetical protein